MASELRVDTLKDSSGNNSIATSFVAAGSAKAFGLFNGTGTIATRKSLNVSGITDVTSGRMTVAFSTSMDSGDYTTSLTSELDDIVGTAKTYNPEIYSRVAGSVDLATYSNTAEQDHEYVEIILHGDLA
tara:strand:+ start:730 stop:1116 length:387 start_codon:yes stop_codon:yes gene_type:complete